MKENSKCDKITAEFNANQCVYEVEIPIDKRPMGHIAHLRNQSKSINTFEKSNNYIITLSKVTRPVMVFICKTLSFITQGCFELSLVEIEPAVMEKKIFFFKCRQFIFDIS